MQQLEAAHIKQQFVVSGRFIKEDLLWENKSHAFIFN
jgi:hypothetical protein